MNKPLLVLTIAIISAAMSQGAFAQTPPSDTLTITTYYPAPYGEYVQLRLTPQTPSTPLTCTSGEEGSMYYDDTDNQSQVYFCNGEVWVPMGGGYWRGLNNHIFNINTANVGIGTGTTAPTAKLEVKGGSIKATDGLIVEVRATDPTSPETGRIWLISP